MGKTSVARLPIIPTLPPEFIPLVAAAIPGGDDPAEIPVNAATTTPIPTWLASHVWTARDGFERRCNRRERPRGVIYDERCHHCSYERLNAEATTEGGLQLDESYLAVHPYESCACPECEEARQVEG
jgi:hypothetical protein